MHLRSTISRIESLAATAAVSSSVAISSSVVTYTLHFIRVIENGLSQIRCHFRLSLCLGALPLMAGVIVCCYNFFKMFRYAVAFGHVAILQYGTLSLYNLWPP